jgi:hypothetical protein
VAVTADEMRARRTNETARRIERELGELVGAFDPDAVPVFDSPALWQVFDRIERFAAAAKVLLASKVEIEGTWRRERYRSAAEHLARVSGTTVAAAQRTLDTSRALQSLPEAADAVRRGDLSSAQADAIAPAALADPGAQRDLLDTAQRTNITELREECLRTKAAADPDPEATHRRIAKQRHARTFTDGEGAWNFVARGTADQGARFQAVLDPIIDEHFKAAHADGREEPREAYAFDALMDLAERAGNGGSTERKRPNPRYLALLRIDADALVRGHVEGEETCEIAGVGPVPVRVARELLGDAICKLVITKGVDVANVVHLGRGPTAAQRIALMWSQWKCSNEACSRTFTEFDHNEPWATTRHTVLRELDRLCDHDHDLKTRHGWSLVNGTGRRALVPPTDPRHPNTRPPP